MIDFWEVFTNCTKEIKGILSTFNIFQLWKWNWPVESGKALQWPDRKRRGHPAQDQEPAFWNLLKNVEHTHNPMNQYLLPVAGATFKWLLLIYPSHLDCSLAGYLYGAMTGKRREHMHDLSIVKSNRWVVEGKTVLWICKECFSALVARFLSPFLSFLLHHTSIHCLQCQDIISTFSNAKGSRATWKFKTPSWRTSRGRIGCSELDADCFQELCVAIGTAHQVKTQYPTSVNTMINNHNRS